MIAGIGIDLCEIRRIAHAIEGERFLMRVYTAAERERIRSAAPSRRDEIAAGLFAAKEAVAKALGTGFSGFGFSDIEIIPDSAGQPACALYGGAARRFSAIGGARVLLSITHERGMAAATAIIEGGNPL